MKKGIQWYEYVYAGPYRTYERAEESMYDSFANGDIDHSSDPRIVALRNHPGKITGYALVLTDYNLKHACD